MGGHLAVDRLGSAPLELWIAPLRQRLRTLAKIFGAYQRALRQHLELLESHLVEPVTFVDYPFREPDRERRVARHLSRKFLGRRQMRSFRDQSLLQRAQFELR